MKQFLRVLSAGLLGFLGALSLSVLSQDGPGPDPGPGSGSPAGGTFATQYNASGGLFGGTGPGTSGHVLTSNGAGLAPSYQAAPSSPPGGASTNVQYNQAGAFEGEAAFTYNQTTNTLTADNIVAGVSCTGCGSPGGATTQVQFNNAGAFGGDAGMTYVAATDALTVAGTVDANKLQALGGSSSDVALRLAANSVNSGFFSPGPSASGNITWVRGGNTVIAVGTSVSIASPTGNLALSGASGVRSDSNTIIDPAGGTDELTVTDGLVAAGVLVTTPASTTTTAGLRLPHGSAPTSPVNGDMWTTTAGLFIQINGSTVGPLN